MPHAVSVALLTGIVTLLSSASTAQEVSVDFDTTRSITLKGTVMAFLIPLGATPAVLALRVTDPGGRPVFWFLTGSPADDLRRARWNAESVTWQEVVSVSAYRARPGAKAAEKLAALLEAVPGPAGMGPPTFLIDALRKKDALLARGIEITRADGTKLNFGAR